MGNATPRRGPSPAGNVRRPPLRNVYRARVRAARDLGVPAPRAAGPPGSLPRRIAELDRRIAGQLERAGGMHLPPWEEPEDDDPGGEDPAPGLARS